jgi:hypothetical protein
VAATFTPEAGLSRLFLFPKLDTRRWEFLPDSV